MKRGWLLAAVAGVGLALSAASGPTTLPAPSAWVDWTKAVVAICVLLLPVAAVGAVGVPVRPTDVFTVGLG